MPGIPLLHTNEDLLRGDDVLMPVPNCDRQHSETAYFPCLPVRSSMCEFTYRLRSSIQHFNLQQSTTLQNNPIRNTRGLVSSPSTGSLHIPLQRICPFLPACISRGRKSAFIPATTVNGIPEPHRKMAAATSASHRKMAAATTEPRRKMSVATSEPRRKMSVATSEPHRKMATAKHEPSDKMAAATPEPSDKMATATTEPSFKLDATTTEPSAIMAPIFVPLGLLVEYEGMSWSPESAPDCSCPRVSSRLSTRARSSPRVSSRLSTRARSTPRASSRLSTRARSSPRASYIAMVGVAKATEASPPWCHEGPDSPWCPEVPNPPWRSKTPDPPWRPPYLSSPPLSSVCRSPGRPPPPPRLFHPRLFHPRCVDAPTGRGRYCHSLTFSGLHFPVSLLSFTCSHSVITRTCSQSALHHH
ncbi:hypothetical protein DPX16_12657 [Anabarilius grahami]|uniref:Uncharacterized protein n=1 Tax=Anabarilius grahami TaxID=495550 RepID=A0A3N0YKU0_ANAGA|nr:hypothetical protein DPX16_12657 [Anabarilius grahami]